MVNLFFICGGGYANFNEKMASVEIGRFLCWLFFGKNLIKILSPFGSQVNSYKVRKRFFTWRERASPLPPLEVNSSGSTLTPGRGLIAIGLMMDF